MDIIEQGYAEQESINTQAEFETGVKCKCTFAQHIVGDGCDICNPEYLKEQK